MKNILISIIGEEIIPNYRAFKDIAPDVLVHICSKQTTSISEKMLEYVKKSDPKINAQNIKVSDAFSIQQCKK